MRKRVVVLMCLAAVVALCAWRCGDDGKDYAPQALEAERRSSQARQELAETREELAGQKAELRRADEKLSATDEALRGRDRELARERASRLAAESRVESTREDVFVLICVAFGASLVALVLAFLTLRERRSRRALLRLFLWLTKEARDDRKQT